MTEIDVPDWAVSAAMRAEDKFYAEKNYGSFSDIQGDDAAEAMRAALAAALGAWVVPVDWQVRYKFSNYGWSQWTGYPTEEIAKEVFRQISGHGATVERRTLYTLRKEKPE